MSNRSLLDYDEFINAYMDRIKVIDTPLGHVDIYEEVSLFEDAQNIKVNIEAKLYRPDLLIELLGGVWKHIERIIETKRIATWGYFPIRIVSWNSYSLEGMWVPYHYCYAFHYLVDLTISNEPKLSLRDILWPWLFDGDQMWQLKESLLPNHLGVHILTFTTDGHLVLLKRSSQRLSAGVGSLSVIEGTVTSRKLRSHETTLYDLAMEEIEEETGVGSALIYVLSYFRSPRLMGRPSIGMIAILDAKHSELRSSWEGNLKYVKIASEISDIEDVLSLADVITRKLATTKHRKFSPTLRRLIKKLIVFQE